MAMTNSPEHNGDKDEEGLPIEQVRMTVSTADDPTLPIWTFRMWFLGLLSCNLMSFLNQFRLLDGVADDNADHDLGSVAPREVFPSRVLPTAKFRLPRLSGQWFSLNPRPFNMKEHVLISIFANAGYAFGNENAYTADIVNIIKAFYHRNISFGASWILIITTQVLGYSWDELMRKYVVEPAHMWWPSTLVQT